MKNSFLFKSMIDIFFLLQVLGLIALFGKILIAFMPVKNMEPVHLNEWVFLISNCIVYIIFLRGLFFLRKIAGEFLRNKTLTKTVMSLMKKTGIHFTLAGLILLITILTEKLFDLQLEPITELFNVTPIFLVIIGLFFIIQSQTLLEAIKMKNENDLMV